MGEDIPWIDEEVRRENWESIGFKDFPSFCAFEGYPFLVSKNAFRC